MATIDSKFQVRAVRVLLLAAFVLRGVNLDRFGLMYDERITQAVVDNILHGDFRNNWKFADVPAQYRVDFYNFSSYFYTDAAFVRILRCFADAPPAHPVQWDRLGSAIAGTLAALLFYWLARKWFDDLTALILLAFLAVTPLLVQDAHYARPEAFELLLVGLLYLLATRLHEGKFRYSKLAAACACAGFLGAMKFSLLPMIAVVLFWVPGDLWRHRVSMVRVVLIAAGAAVLGMFAGVPDAFFHPHAYWNGVQFLRTQYSGVHQPHGNLGGGNTFGMIVKYFWQTLGPVLSMLAAVGAITLLRMKGKLVWVSICIPIASYFAAFSMQSTFFERNLSHVAPLMLMLSAAGLTYMVEYARTRTNSRWIPSVAAMVLLIGAIAPPALLSSRLVFVALTTDSEARAKEYEAKLRERTGRTIKESGMLQRDQDITHMISLAQENERGVLVRVVDYNDPFTVQRMAELGRQVRLQEVGYFPSLFANVSVCTLNVYHSPALRYLFLTSRTDRPIVIGGWKFRRLGDAAHELEAGHVEMDSWVENGYHPSAGAPGVEGQYFGSWTQQREDENTGTLRIGPVEVQDGVTLGIPIVTGPSNQGLEISVKDHATGAELARMDPPPVLTSWKLWQVDLPEGRKLALDIVAGDRGSGFGQWLAIGAPRAIDNMFERLGAEAPNKGVAIKGSWTKNGYYPDVGPPPVDDAVYGSWSGSDANVGSLRLGPIRVSQQARGIAIPLVTGPSNGGLSIKIVDAKTKGTIASLNPVPVHVTWWVWNVAVASGAVEIVAEDAGTGQGQWMAVGQPHVVK